MFINAELSQIPIAEGRKAERRIVNLAAALREEGAKSIPIVVLDISLGGFKAHAGEPLEQGSEVWLKMSGWEARRSRIVWTEGMEIGCEFEYPLHPRELVQIMAPAPRRVTRGVFGRI